MQTLSQLRFDALAGYVRRPGPYPWVEVEWYRSDNERVVGLIAFDLIDRDFSVALLGRDRNRQFRWVQGRVSIATVEEARADADERLSRLADAPDEELFQGDETGRPFNLFADIARPERRSPVFVDLVGHERYSPAKELVAAMSPYFRDIDGNFIEQFQTTAFDARLWELYLFATLHEIGYGFERTHAAPDFHCVNYRGEFFVEAVTVQPTQGGATISLTDAQAIAEYQMNYVPIKFGSALVSKLRKQYWTLPHVTGKPLIIAVQDFHLPGSMMFTGTALGTYLYGMAHDATRDQNGHLVITPRQITEHRWGEKVIESNFFGLPGAENISAVIANPHGTITKFNRIGVLAGFGSTRVQMRRFGKAYVHDPDASEPGKFAYDVRSFGYEEQWREGMSVYHNPNALVPLNPELFPGVAHYRLRSDGMIESDMPKFHAYQSFTQITLDGECEENAD